MALRGRQDLGFEIATAGNADAAGMARLLRMSTYGLIDLVFDGQSTEPWFADPASRHRRGACLKAVAGGRIVGHAVAYAATPESGLPVLPPVPGEAGRAILDRIKAASRPGSWYLSSLAVDPGVRRRGIGRALLQAALAEGLARGFAEASLHVFEGNLPAVALYGGFGFRPVGAVDLPRPRDPAIRGEGRLIAMAAPLAQATLRKKIEPL